MDKQYLRLVINPTSCTLHPTPYTLVFLRPDCLRVAGALCAPLVHSVRRRARRDDAKVMRRSVVLEPERAPKDVPHIVSHGEFARSSCFHRRLLNDQLVRTQRCASRFFEQLTRRWSINVDRGSKKASMRDSSEVKRKLGAKER